MLRWGLVRWADHQGGSFAYVLWPAGARRLVEVADDRGFVTAVDEFQRRSSDVLTMVECVPHLVRTTVLEDSDVQTDAEASPG